ncbi:MFS transporter [Candidatus Bathyarchaeota archaeon]|nr:MFS transporter [Candidatus Bathyarchaeota archaeon]
MVWTEYKWVALTVTTVGTFMVALDASVLIVGLPVLLRELEATLLHGVWVITGYRLAITILLVAIGRVADMLGRIRLYVLGFAVFTFSSALCGLSQSGEQLVVFRLLQGIGGALIIVNSVAVIADAFPASQLGTGIGINFMAFNLGSIIGYTLSGVIVELAGWRFIFLMNIPIGLFGTFWARLRLREIYHGVAEKFDYPGAVLYSCALTLILAALSLENLSSPASLALLILGLLTLILFVTVERRVAHPTLDLDLFRIRLFTAGNLASFLNSLAFNALPFLLTLYFQLIRGQNALTTGILFIPLEAAVLLVGPLSGRLSDTYGARGLCTLGLLFSGGALLWFGTIDMNTDYTALTLALVASGIGRGLFISPNASSIMGPVPASRRGVANGVRTTIVQTGIVVSLPLSLAFMTLGMPHSQLSQLTGGSTSLNLESINAFLSAIHYAFHMLAAVTFLALIPSALRGRRVIT